MDTNNIAYLEQRLARTLLLKADSIDTCAKASHTALAKLYRRELMKLTTGQYSVAAGNAALDHTYQAGLLLVDGEPA